MKKVLLSAVLVLVATNAFALLTGSSHDLSVGGTNPSKGTSDQLCKYCHVPHNATVPAALWARATITQPVAFYTNPGSLNSAVPASITSTQSTACLSCHNATPSNGYDASTNLSAGIVTANKIIGEAVTGLSNDHPIAFVYNAALVTADTATGGQVGLQTPVTNTVNNGVGTALPLYGATYTLECATCHAVHGLGTNPSFLRTTAAGSKICLKCHIK